MSKKTTKLDKSEVYETIVIENFIFKKVNLKRYKLFLKFINRVNHFDEYILLYNKFLSLSDNLKNHFTTDHSEYNVEEKDKWRLDFYKHWNNFIEGKYNMKNLLGITYYCDYLLNNSYEIGTFIYNNKIYYARSEVIFHFVDENDNIVGQHFPEDIDWSNINGEYFG